MSNYSKTLEEVCVENSLLTVSIIKGMKKLMGKIIEK